MSAQTQRQTRPGHLGIFKLVFDPGTLSSNAVSLESINKTGQSRTALVEANPCKAKLGFYP